MGVSAVEKLLLTKHLAIMLKAGIPLTEAVNVVIAQTKNSAFKNLLTGIEANLRNGQTLEKSLSKYPKVFDPLYRSIVAIGEESGVLEKNLNYLASQLERTYEFRRKVQGALLYPVIVLLTMAIVGSGIALFVLPQLVELFQSLEVELPLSTKILLFVATAMKSHGVIIIASFFGVIALFVLAVQTRLVKPVWQRFLLRLPVFGNLRQQMEMAMFCRNLGIMLRSGLPIAAALKSCGEATENLIYKAYVLGLEKAVNSGSTIENELSNGKYPLVPTMVTKMVGIGEKSGNLDEVLLYLADFFEEEVDHMTKSLSTILEPILLFVIALVVGFLALSIISPIYKFTGSVGN